MSPDEIKFPIIIAGILGIFIWIIRFYIPGYLSEKGKNLATREDIEKITAQVEGVKLHYAVLLQRRSRIHERQVEILGKLYKSIFKVQRYLQLMTKSAIYEGEKTSEYPKLLQSAIKEADCEFIMGRLFLPAEVANQVNAFFEKINEVGIQLGMAQHPNIPDGKERGRYWEEAQEIAHKQLPGILQKIEERVRSIIHEA